MKVHVARVPHWNVDCHACLLALYTYLQEIQVCCTLKKIKLFFICGIISGLLHLFESIIGKPVNVILLVGERCGLAGYINKCCWYGTHTDYIFHVQWVGLFSS